MIQGVKLIDLAVQQDDRGDLFEICHDYDLVKFGQVYIVHNRMPYIVRAFHKHKELWDYFCIVHGSAAFCLVDDRAQREGKTPAEEDIPQLIQRVVLTARKPRLLVVPPEVYHGWMSLTPDTILASIGSELYNKQAPDEERVPPSTFDQLFGRNPWEIWTK